MLFSTLCLTLFLSSSGVLLTGGRGVTQVFFLIRVCERRPITHPRHLSLSCTCARVRLCGVFLPLSVRVRPAAGIVALSIGRVVYVVQRPTGLTGAVTLSPNRR